MSISIQDLMALGRNDEAIDRLKELLAEQRTPSNLVSLGVGYLWKGDYASAAAHCDELNAERPKHSATYYELSGAAKWCMERRSDAYDTWNAGYKCAYGDGAGNMTMPLLIYFAAVRDHGSAELERAANLLASRLRHPYSKNWPGPLARYLLGEIQDGDLEFKVFGEPESWAKYRRRTAEFCRAIVDWRNDDRASYREHMRGACLIDEPNDARSGMFYIARHESREVGSGSGL